MTYKQSSDSDQSIQIIGEYYLGWLLQPLSTHPAYGSNHLFRLDKLTTYLRKEKCHICGHSNQANNIARIVNDTTGEITYSGLDCLGKSFHIGRKDVMKHLESTAALAKRVGRLSGKTSFSNEREAVADILKLVNDLPDVSGIAESRLILEQALAAERVALDSLQTVVSFILEVQESVKFPELFHARLNAFQNDPMWHDSESEVRRHLSRITQPYDLNPHMVAEMNTMRSKLLSRNPAAKDRNKTILPWLFPNAAAYELALEAYYRLQADNGEHSTQLLEKAAVKRNLTVENMAKKMPFVIAAPIEINGEIRSDWTHYTLLTRLAKAGNRDVRSLRRYLSPKKYSAEVRRDTYKAMFKRVFYQSLAVWEVRPWNPIYSLWNHYESQGGREYLLKPHRL